MTLEELMQLCRKYGIVQFKGSIPGSPSLVDLTFGDVFAIDAQSTQDVDKPVETLKPRLGKDGLTAEQQIDLYGRKIDAE